MSCAGELTGDTFHFETYLVLVVKEVEGIVRVNIFVKEKRFKKGITTDVKSNDEFIFSTSHHPLLQIMLGNILDTVEIYIFYQLFSQMLINS